MRPETKVAVPAISSAVLAILALFTAFGLDLTDEQKNAILGAVVGAVPLVVLFTGQAAPHTSRPDLAETHPEAEADVEAWAEEQEAEA